MSNLNRWESQLRSWTPRRPSARLKSQIFRPTTVSVAGPEPSVAFGGGWRWLAPAMGLFLWATIVLSPRNDQIAYLAAASTNDLLSTLASHHGYAYVAATFHSKQNALEDGFEWTNKARSISSPRGSSLLRTNTLLH